VPIGGVGFKGIGLLMSRPKISSTAPIKKFADLGLKIRSPNWIFLFIPKNILQEKGNLKMQIRRLLLKKKTGSWRNIKCVSIFLEI
jgi:hypothetical protein